MTDQEKFLTTAKRVIADEATALNTLGPSFGATIDLLLAARERIIVSGMGKSGHVARRQQHSACDKINPHERYPADKRPKGFCVVGVRDDDGYLKGIITDGDLRRHMTGLLDMTAGHVMTGNPSTVAPDTLAADVIGVMKGKITCLFGVGDDAREQGILHISDCLRAGVV